MKETLCFIEAKVLHLFPYLLILRVKRDGLQLLAAETSTVQSGDINADDADDEEYNDESRQGMILHQAIGVGDVKF